MEILRFEEAPSGAPKRKKSSRSFLALGLVATLFGISTAFASSTITINGPTNLVALGQGVAAVLGCDPDVTITPDAGLNAQIASPTPTVDPTSGATSTPVPVAPAPTFNLSTITVSSIDTNETDATSGLGCGLVDFKIQVFHTITLSEGRKQEAAYTCEELKGGPTGTITSSSSDMVTGKIVCADDAIFFRVANTSKANGSVEIALNGSSDIDYITLVSTNYTGY
jgi:hypothetical protein